MANVDMGIYHSFTGDADGNVDKKYCPQLCNQTLAKCDELDPNGNYMPLSANAAIALEYADSNVVFANDLFDAYFKMLNFQNGAGALTDFFPAWNCVDGAYVCQGDIFEQNCAGITQPTTAC